MPELVLPLPGWMPDATNFGSPGVVQAKNVLPNREGYQPLQSFVAFSTNALAARARGFITARDSSGNWHFYCGDATDLYKLVGTSLTNASSTLMGSYTLATADNWEFAAFNNDIIAVTNYDTPAQHTSIGSLTFSVTLITSTDKPKMKHIASLRDFVVGGNISSTAGGLTPSRLWWCAIRDASDWTPNLATQCGFVDIVEGGPIQRILGGAEYAIVFQENQISRMDYVGSPPVFDITPVDRRRGTPYPKSVVGWGRNVFYIADEGFMVTDGVESVPIGENQVDRHFTQNFSPQEAHLLSSSIDPINKNVFWSIPNFGVYCYHWPERKWAFLELAIQYIGDVGLPGYTLEGLDAVTSASAGAGTALDDTSLLDVSLDSAKWKGGNLRSGGFDGTNTFGTFDGPNMTGVIETAEFQPVPGKRTQINSVVPFVQGGRIEGVDCSIGSRTRLNANREYSVSSEMNTNGECQMRAEGNYHTVLVSLSASMSWSSIAGVKVLFEESGGR